jgi:hypothetical protein
MIECLKQLSNKDEKLILFVPLKCEKYMFEKRMNEVANAVKTAYKALISDIQNNYGDRMACAVTPILTLGGVLFSDFGRNTNGISVNGLDNCPDTVNYTFNRNSPNYNPLFCIQPLYYLLSFVTKQYKSGQSGSVINQLKSNLALLFSSDTDFFKEVENLSDNIKTTGEGYYIIHNNNKI